MEFEWDPCKAAANLRKHGVSFNEAATVFGDFLGATVVDPDRSTDESRYITVGSSNRGRVLMVACGAWRSDSHYQCSNPD